MDRFVTGGSAQDDDCTDPCEYDALSTWDMTFIFDRSNVEMTTFVFIIPDDWEATTEYTAGAGGDYGGMVKPTVDNGYWYECTTGGTTAGTEPSPWNTTPGGTTSDGMVTWTTRDEDDPNYVQPDYTEAVGTPTAYAGAGRWFMFDMMGRRVKTPQSDQDSGAILFYEDSDNGSNYQGWQGPAAVTDDLLFRMTDTNPVSSSISLWATPAAGESAQTWGLLDVTIDDPGSDTNIPTEQAVREIVGAIPDLIDKTADYTITGSEVQGHVFTNNGDTGTLVFTLPDGSAEDYVTIVVAEAYQVDIDPNGSEQILALTDAGGDKISNSGTVGNMVTLLWISASEIVAIGYIGTWTDAN
jgi:hypothetical protein